MVPPALTPTKIVIAPAKLWPPDVEVKQSSHQMPETPPTVPFVVLVLGQALMSGNWLVRDWSAVSFTCCADCAVCVPLLITIVPRSEEHTSELQSLRHLVCRLLLEKKNTIV